MAVGADLLERIPDEGMVTEQELRADFVGKTRGVGRGIERDGYPRDRGGRIADLEPDPITGEGVACRGKLFEGVKNVAEDGHAGSVAQKRRRRGLTRLVQLTLC